MHITYDPDETPKIDATTMREAMDLGVYPIAVFCDERGAKVGDAGGVGFIGWGNFVPRKGERIRLEDGNVCEVSHVFYKLASRPDSKLLMLVPNVFATRITPDKGTE